MADFSGNPLVRRVAQTCRIIVLALFAGQAMLVAVAFAVRATSTDPPGSASAVVSLVAAALAAPLVVLRFVVPAAVLRAGAAGAAPAPPRPGAADTDPRIPALAAAWQRGVILGGALVESGGLLGGVAYLLEGRPWVLIPAGACMLLTLLPFPSAEALSRFIEDRLAHSGNR